MHKDVSFVIVSCSSLPFITLLSCVMFADAGGLNTYGDVLLAGGSSYSLLVQINSTFNASAFFLDNATFQAPSSFQAPSIFNSNATFQGMSTFENSTAFQSPALFQSNATFQGLSSFQNATTFNATSTFQDTTSFQAPSTFQDTTTFLAPSAFQAPVQLQSSLSMAPNAVLNVTGTAILGSARTDALQVNAAATFNSPVSFASSISLPPGTTLNATSDTHIGTSSDDQLTVNAASVFLAALQAEDEVQIGNLLQVQGDTILGNDSSDECLVHCAASFQGPVDLLNTDRLPNSASVIAFQRKLGDSPVTTSTLMGEVLFSGWDGAVQGSGASIQAVYTVRHAVAFVCYSLSTQGDMLLPLICQFGCYPARVMLVCTSHTCRCMSMLSSST